MKFQTTSIHAGEEPDFKEGSFGEVVRGIHLSSTFATRTPGETTAGFDYSRTGNPTRKSLEEKLAAIEGARFGLALSSGLAAESTVMLSLMKSGERVIAFNDLYGGTRRLLDRVLAPNFGVKISYVDARNLDEIRSAIMDGAGMIYIETPTNPVMKLCDIAAISSLAHDLDIPLVVDNTFASPYFQNPLSLGADVVLHSTTKYINGHSDSIGGAVMVNNEQYYERIKFNQNAIGAILSPFDSFLVMRGIKTLGVRMREHEKNAMAVARFLEDHPLVKKVNYPGLDSHPQHDLAVRQMRGFSGMLSFELDCDPSKIPLFLRSLRIISLAESLGGVESLIEVPSLMTHRGIDRDERISLGITDNLIRLSVGIEDLDDIITDLETGFKSIT